MNVLWIDILGWLGVVLFLVAYILVSIRKLEGDSISYQVMNIVAGIFLVVNSLYYRAMPSVGVNVAWIGIGLFALGRRKFLGIKANIEMIYLPDEMFSQKEKKIDMVVGKKIPWQTFDRSRSPAEWADWVKDQSYGLESYLK